MRAMVGRRGHGHGAAVIVTAPAVIVAGAAVIVTGAAAIVAGAAGFVSAHGPVRAPRRFW
jgi:hypothetical protein